MTKPYHWIVILALPGIYMIDTQRKRISWIEANLFCLDLLQWFIFCAYPRGKFLELFEMIKIDIGYNKTYVS